MTRKNSLWDKRFFLTQDLNSSLYSPIKRKCTYCNVEVVTYVEQESHPLFMLVAMMVIIIFGLLALIILPFGYLVTKSAVHRCSRCLQKMGEKRCFGIPTNFSDEVCLICSKPNRSGSSDLESAT
jgi:hypothetical protein